MTSLESLTTQLDATQDRLALALEAAQVGVWEWDVESGRLDWDANMFRLFGLKPENFGNDYQSFIDQLVPEDAALADHLLRHAVDNRTRYDFRYRLKNGRMIRGSGKCYYRLGIAVRFVGVCVSEREVCTRRECPNRLSPH